MTGAAGRARVEQGMRGDSHLICEAALIYATSEQGSVIKSSNDHSADASPCLPQGGAAYCLTDYQFIRMYQSFTVKTSG